MNRSLSLVTFVVDDYDKGISFFVNVLGFALLQDAPVPGEAEGKRWVVVAPPGHGSAILIAKGSGPEQEVAIGNQAGGRVAFFLETDDFDRDHAALTEAGIAFLEAPRDEAYGRVAKWRDPFGNLWDLLQRR